MKSIMSEKWKSVYTQRFGGTWYPNEGVVKFIARYIQRKVGIDTYDVKKGIKKVFDLGCGNGRHVIFLAEQGFEVYGMDISEEAIRIAKAWLARKGLKADLRSGDIERLAFEDNFFDLIIASEVLDHIPFSKAMDVMNEIKRICTPQGYIYITLRSTEDSEFGRGRKVEHNTFRLEEGYEKGIIQHYFDLKEIKELFAGFKIFDIEIHEERFPDIFSIDKAFLQSSKLTKRYIDFSKPIDINLKYSRWHIAAEKTRSRL